MPVNLSTLDRPLSSSTDELPEAPLSSSIQLPDTTSNRRNFLTKIIPAGLAVALVGMSTQEAEAMAADGGILTVNGEQYQVVMTKVLQGTPVPPATATPSPTATLLPTATPTATPTGVGLPRYSLANKGVMTVDQYAAYACAQRPQGGFEFFIPGGNWTHSGLLTFQNMRDFKITGEGEQSKLIATNMGAAALRLKNVTNFTLQKFDIVHNNPSTRLNPPESAGLHLQGAQDGLIQGVYVDTTASAGMWSEQLNTATVPRFSERLTYEDCIIRKTLSDGIHNTNGCKDILVIRCKAYDTGDDSFSGINYTGSSRQIDNYWVEDCVAESNGIGVGNHFSIEGAKNSGFRNPTSFRSRTAPLRFASMGQWSKIPNNNVQCIGGNVYDGRTSGTGHPGGFLIYAGAADQNNVLIDGLNIWRPNNWVAIQSNGELGFRVRGLTIKNTKVMREGKLICQGFGQFDDTDNLVQENNRFDGVVTAFILRENISARWQSYLHKEFDGALLAA